MLPSGFCCGVRSAYRPSQPVLPRHVGPAGRPVLHRVEVAEVLLRCCRRRARTRRRRSCSSGWRATAGSCAGGSRFPLARGCRPRSARSRRGRPLAIVVEAVLDGHERVEVVVATLSGDVHADRCAGRQHVGFAGAPRERQPAALDEVEPQRRGRRRRPRRRRVARGSGGGWWCRSSSAPQLTMNSGLLKTSCMVPQARVDHVPRAGALTYASTASRVRRRHVVQPGEAAAPCRPQWTRVASAKSLRIVGFC